MFSFLPLPSYQFVLSDLPAGFFDSNCKPMQKYRTNTSCPRTQRIPTCNPHDQHHHAISFHPPHARRKIPAPPPRVNKATQQVQNRSTFEHMYSLSLTRVAPNNRSFVYCTVVLLTAITILKLRLQVPDTSPCRFALSAFAPLLAYFTY